MTVCLAALCGGENGNAATHAVVAADRMVTMGGFIEFEHAVPKMALPSPLAVSMIAGDTLVGTRLAREVAASMAGVAPRTSDIADALAQHYELVRREKVEHEILVPRGLNFGQFYGGHASFNPNITMMIDQRMTDYNLGVELLLAGVDAGGAHIFTIHNPGGGPLQHDVIGYAATGSGMLQAIQSMIGFEHHAGIGLKDTVFRVYASKRRAEVAPGVGHDTDLGIISPAGIEWLSADQLDALATVYEDYEQSVDTALAAGLDALQLPQPTPTPTPTEETNGANHDDGAAPDPDIPTPD